MFDAEIINRLPKWFPPCSEEVQGLCIAEHTYAGVIQLCANCCWLSEICAMFVIFFSRDLEWKKVKSCCGCSRATTPTNQGGIILWEHPLLDMLTIGKKCTKWIRSGCLFVFVDVAIRHYFGIKCCLHQNMKCYICFHFVLSRACMQSYQSWSNMCWHL